MDALIVTVLGVFSIGFIWYFFFGPRKGKTAKGSEVDIIVDGGYIPDTIIAPAGSPVTLNFLRKDPSDCLEEVTIPDLKIRKVLPLGKKVSVHLPPQKPGRYKISCGMQMFHAVLIIQ